MTKILWLTNRSVTMEQMGELKKKFGEIDIIKSKVNTKYAKDIMSLRDEVGADEIVVSVSDSVLADLTDPHINKGAMPIQPIMYSKINQDGTSKLMHSYFERVLGVEVITSPLSIS